MISESFRNGINSETRTLSTRTHKRYDQVLAPVLNIEAKYNMWFLEAKKTFNLKFEESQAPSIWQDHGIYFGPLPSLLRTLQAFSKSIPFLKQSCGFSGNGPEAVQLTMSNFFWVALLYGPSRENWSVLATNNGKDTLERYRSNGMDIRTLQKQCFYQRKHATSTLVVETRSIVALSKWSCTWMEIFHPTVNI